MVSYCFFIIAAEINSETTTKYQTNVAILTTTIVSAYLISLSFCCRHDSERLAKEQADAAERMKVARLK